MNRIIELEPGEEIDVCFDNGEAVTIRATIDYAEMDRRLERAVETVRELNSQI